MKQIVTKTSTRIPKGITDVMYASIEAERRAGRKAPSFNALLVEMLLACIQQWALSGRLGNDIAMLASPAAVAAQLLARVEQAKDAAVELRWLAESGSVSREQFDELRKSLAEETRKQMINDIRINGPIVWREHDDREAVHIRRERVDALVDVRGHDEGLGANPASVIDPEGIQPELIERTEVEKAMDRDATFLDGIE